MRIDKFLWCVRLFKTRSLANQQVQSEKILMDDHTVKPSRELKPGDAFSIKHHGYTLSYRVIDIPRSRVGAKLVPDYLMEITTEEELQKKDFIALAKNIGRQKGAGRPTKKERRDLDELGL